MTTKLGLGERGESFNATQVRGDPLMSSVGITFSMDSGMRRNDIVG